MKIRLTLSAVLLVLPTLLPVSTAAADKVLARGVVQTEFGIWTPALRLESKDAAPKAVLVPGFGGRVLSYGTGNGNILWNEPAGAPAAPTETGYRAGGFQTVLGPEVAGLPPQPALGHGPYDFSLRRGSMIQLRSGDENSVEASIEKEVMFDPSTGDVGFLFRMKNLANRDAALSFWHRIACQPGGFVILPLSRKSRFPSGWSVRREAEGKAVWDGAAPKAEGVEVQDGILVARTGAGAARVGADSDAQWVAYVLGRTLFILHFPYYANAVYAEGGNSVTFAWDERSTELQPIGPEARLRSRKTAELPMKWSLVQLPAEVTTPAGARALASQVPVSPFL